MDLDIGCATLVGLSAIHSNLSRPELYEHALRVGDGQLAEGGALVTNTGQYTGRSPKDKYIVSDEETEGAIWWDGKEAHPWPRERFNAMLARQIEYLKGKDVYVRDCYAGADEKHRLAVRVVNERAWHNLFADNMFIPERDPAKQASFAPDFTIIHTPHLEAIPDQDGTRSEVFVVLDFKQRTILIGGTRYAGEIKKSIFTTLNYLLPLKGVLGMHCSANIGEGGDTALFFGLSGTGKTTLSADPERALIGDDEHGWGDNGVFNFEGGCYAKVINLSPEAEPEIHATTKMYGTILENVAFAGDTRSLDLDDARFTQNTRASYPLTSIPNVVPSGTGGHPKHVIMLTCDAFGVLPPIARMTPAQAMYHFISGYTAKVAGTERGVTEPKATFSACFGAPFMPLHPAVYAEQLGAAVDKHGATCWLVNTGWSGGPYGVGKRMPIAYSRALLRAALMGDLDNVEMRADPTFGFDVPTTCPGVPDEVLRPRDTWEDGASYDSRAAALAEMFQTNFAAFKDRSSAEIAGAGPRVTQTNG